MKKVADTWLVVTAPAADESTSDHAEPPSEAQGENACDEGWVRSVMLVTVGSIYYIEFPFVLDQHRATLRDVPPLVLTSKDVVTEGLIVIYSTCAWSHPSCGRYLLSGESQQCK